MFCNCVKDQNYQVIGLCDVSKAGPFAAGESWTQISIPEVVTIPCEKPDVESVDKVFINAKIVYKKIIVTPPVPADSATLPVPVENREGTKLTGRKLLVEGVLCQKIVYTADVCEQSVHAANFNVPFSTFIVLPPEVDPDIDEFCVEPCIEDVYAKVINGRKVFKNVTLFLRAKKIELVC